MRRTSRFGVMAWTTALGLAAAFLTVRFLWGVGPAAPHTHVPWYVLVVGFALSEVFVVHLDVRRDTFSVSLMELPFVVGLFLSSPTSLLTGRLVGGGLALAVHRRQRPLKLVFNLCLFATETAAAVTVFHSLAGRVTVVGPGSWAAAFTAAIVANVVSVTSIGVMIHLSGGNRMRIRDFSASALLAAIANTCLALGAVALSWDQPQTVWLIAGIAVVLVVGYRAHALQRQRYANLRRLYAFTRSIHQLTNPDDLVATLLTSTQDMLRADVCELAVISSDGSANVVITSARRDDELATRTVALAEMSSTWHRVVSENVSVVIRREHRTADRAGSSAGDIYKDCIIVPMTAGGRVVATVTVADREGDIVSFDDGDLQFFETVVNHIDVALENARLMGRLEHDALHDSLTGLPNRNRFQRDVEAAIGGRERGSKVAVVLMDLDRFKEVNDTLGHHHGDRLLCEVGARLDRALPESVTIARLGGDEFGLVCRDLADGDDAVQLARFVRDLLGRPFTLGDLVVDVGAAVGIALCPDHGEDATTLMQRADVAMYSAKSGSGVELYTVERDQYSPRRLALVGELRQALEREELEVHYQPKVDVVSGVVLGAEALVRWRHPVQGLVSPGEFIPLAEHTGLIQPLTSYVLRRAVEQCRRWQDDGIDVHAAVNVSARNLADRALVAEVRSALEAHGLSPGRLTLEITESTIASDSTRAIDILDELSSLGVQLSVDDFGTGYSSLAYLKRLPVNEVKIDRSFVANVATDASDVAIVRTVLDLARNLGLTAVAEGVESAETLEQLAALGCPVAQGYYLSVPLPADQFTAWVTSWEGRDARSSVAHLAPRRLAMR